VLTALVGGVILLYALLSSPKAASSSVNNESEKKTVPRASRSSLQGTRPAVEKPLDIEEERKKERLELKRLEKTVEVNNETKKREREQENLRLAQELEELKKMRAERRTKKKPIEEEEPAQVEESKNETNIGQPTATEQRASLDLDKPLLETEESASREIRQDSEVDLTSSIVMVEHPDIHENAEAPTDSPQASQTDSSHQENPVEKTGQEDEWVMIENEQEENTDTRVEKEATSTEL